MKERFTIQASALSSYLGCGYNSIKEQFDIDMGRTEPTFTEEQKSRMNLGKCLESGVLDFFAKRFDINITHRNDEIFTAFDGKVRCLCDGLCEYHGVPTIVECKVSLSDNSITQNMGYHVQCQAYMEGLGYQQCLLIGLQKGEPVGVLIERDDKMIADMAKIVDSVVDILSGISDVDDYLSDNADIILKYSTQTGTKTNRTEIKVDMDVLERITELKEQEKLLSEERKELEESIKKDVDNGFYKDEYYTVSISTISMAGGYNMDMLQLDHPEINFDKYKKSPRTMKRMTIKKRG